MHSTRFLLFLIALVAVGLGTGCSTSKAYTKRGLKMEEVGMMSQAASFYYTAVQKKATNTDALAGLQRAGQWVLNDHLRQFDEARVANDRARAVAAFEAAEAYNNRVAKLGIRLLFMESARQAYEQVKDAHMDELYQAGLAALETEDFADALVQFTEIIRLQADYEDAKHLADVAYCEPHYREATAAIERLHWRTALNGLNAVTARS